MTTDEKIIRKISVRYQLSEDQVEDLVKYSWSLVQRCMNDDRMPGVRLPKLGMFHVKPVKLKRLLIAMEKPDYKYRHTHDFEDYKKRVKMIYLRRLREDYLNNRPSNIPKVLQEDVQKMKDQWNSTEPKQ